MPVNSVVTAQPKIYFDKTLGKQLIRVTTPEKDLVILTVDSRSAVVVHVFKGVSKVGDSYFGDRVSDYYTPYEGTITLSNE